MKKIVSILMIFAVIALSGCNKFTVVQKKAETPQGFIKSMYKNLDSGDLSFKNLYNDDFSDVSKQIISLADFTTAKKAELTDILSDDVLISTISCVVEAEYPDSISKVNTTLQYTLAGAPVTKTFSDYVILIDGKYKYLYNGLLTQKTYNMAATDASNQVHGESASIYTSVTGIKVDLVMTNTTLSNFSFGSAAGSLFVITTSAGEYSVTLPQIYVLNTNQKITLSGNFDGASGTVQKICVKNIYTLNLAAAPIETGDGNQYSISVQ